MPIYLVTGQPRIGKTTAINRLVEMLRERDARVEGVISREVREDGTRTGFEFVDIRTHETCMLASVNGNGPKVGKYAVNLDGCRFAANVLRAALSSADVVVCDELGPMEFKSKEFVKCAQSMLSSNKPVVAVVHKKLKHPVIDSYRENAVLTINIDIQNRNKVPHIMLKKII